MKANCMLALMVAGIFAAAPAMADKPSGSGKGQNSKHSGKSDDKHSKKRDAHESQGEREHFNDRHRAAVNDYYSGEFNRGRCPPGLAKKHNGCMPPGQAKKWKVGRPLPREVIYYDVPRPLVAKLDPAPAGHRYVRVASDILLIALGSGKVVDAIQNLGRS